MRVKPLFTIVFGATSILSITALILSLNESEMLTGIKNTSNNRYLSYQAADELRQSSDELTRLARTYVVTGNADYKKMYKDVLAIRNGQSPRPVGYHSIYWDLVLKYGDKPKPDGEFDNLLERMKSLGFSQQEFDLLDESKRNSDTMVSMELEAMKALERGEQQKAINIMHSKAYHQEKAKIMRPIDKFLHALEERTEAEMVSVEQSADTISTYITATVILMIIAAMGGYYLINQRIVKPITSITTLLTHVQTSKDFTLRSKHNSKDEIGIISRTVNNLIESTQSILKDTKDIAFIVKQNSNDTQSLISTASQSMAVLNSETDTLAISVNELNAALKEVASATSESKEAANNTTETARSGLDLGKQSLDSMEHLQTHITEASSKADALASEFKQIETVLQVIKSIAEQTNLLALNAAIEAARAGDQGRGFAVVADEVRSLARRTQESTGEIDGMLDSLRSIVSETVDTMQTGIKEVENSRESVECTVTSLSNVEKLIEHINDMGFQIASSAEEQSATVNSLSGNINTVRDLSVQTADDTQKLSSASGLLSERAAELENQVKIFKV